MQGRSRETEDKIRALMTKTITRLNFQLDFTWGYKSSAAAAANGRRAVQASAVARRSNRLMKNYDKH